MPLNELKAVDYLKLIRKREISVEQTVKDILKQIDRLEQTLKAYLYINREGALQEAKAIDKKISSGEDIPPLAGLPIAIKDNICTKGIETTCASKMLKGFIPPYDATVIKKIKEAGGIIIGKNNLDEFAMGSSTENSAFQTTLNPWDITRVPGGSSGGSAAAVAAHEALIAIGTDTGGSVRIPASFCGIVGLKPTYGRVSRYGVIPYASSMDNVGVLGKVVEDTALLMNIICGYDDYDSTSADTPVPDFLLSCREGINDLKFGVPREFFGPQVDIEIKEKVKEAINKIEQMGGKLEEISLPYSEYSFPTYYLIVSAEAGSGLARFDGVQYGLRIEDNDNLEDMYKKTRSKGFGAEVLYRIIMGTYALSTGNYDDYYLRAQKVRTLIRKDFENAFRKVDLLVCPTSPELPFKKGRQQKDLLAQFLPDAHIIPVSLAGLPGLSLNCGFSKKVQLPIGLQIIGRPFEEEKVLRAAYNLEIELKEVNSVQPNFTFNSVSG
ncbi:MAG TPA: Asp-tRNA(Asn)/Glu-tRNA(Gln) amidotransferase subunit GatA [Atribacterota bacterium]|nr:Asp-tRNA(Asn)/Glu-tRNA(Gln) amidotransferase subunit GatA [Atribacterota bacterium]